MEKLSTLVYCVLIVAAAVAAPTANEDFVIAEDAQTFTNAVNAAREYTDAATNALDVGVTSVNGASGAVVIPAADFTTSNTTLVATIEAVAPAPGDYAAVSNAALNAVRHAELEEATNTLSGTLEAKVSAAVAAATNYTDAALADFAATGKVWEAESATSASYAYSASQADYAPQSDNSRELRDYSSEVGGRILSLDYPTGRWSAYEEMSWEREGVLAYVSEVQSAARAATNYVNAATNGIPRIVESSEAPGYAANAMDAQYANFASALESSLGGFRYGVEIFAQLDAATQTNAEQTAAISATAQNLATIGAHLNAEDARFVVTNYNSETHTPEAYVEIQLPDTSWLRIWSEMTRWNWLFDHYLPTNYYDKAAVNAALAEKADRAWGFYDSTTGEYAPDEYTWISSEKIAIAANLAYQRTVTSEGAIWVLESNGVVTETGGMTNGFFRISDDEGNSLFEIVKGNKRTVGADASSCQVVAGFTPTKLQIGYSIVSDVHPTLYVCQSLATQNWKAETDSDCIANVSWSGTSGAYVAQVQGKSAYSSMFVKATYEVGGETYISNAAPVSMQYIMIGGVKYAVGVGTVSGTTVLTLTVAP